MNATERTIDLKRLHLEIEQSHASTISMLRDMLWLQDQLVKGEKMMQLRKLSKPMPLTEMDGNGDLPTLEQVTRELVTRAVNRFEGNQSKAARAIGISKHRVWRMLQAMQGEQVVR